MKGNKHNYQIILVLSPKTEDKDKEKVLAKVDTWLGTNSAKVEKKDHTGSKDLIYEIAGFRKGDFWQLEVVGEKPIKLTDLNLYLNRETSVIRYLILKK
jgi:ribosomal protein S6